ncbi:hypothetical protein O181_084144 [Austropuccinia psidii MF-1]|uniref:Uncharacterized protein n=1 Tax=Austropuccinia psidii MF-1 TaxID=1389203 RepID=A0A9Q3FSX0_9BASI|nr:hypothetical protein [Austropuccinia psidii MF-1]
MEEEQEISGLYEENIFEVEDQEKKEDRSESIPNMEEYSSINKGLEQKKESKEKGLFINISKKYGKQGTVCKKKQKDTISKEDHPSSHKMKNPPRIKLFISKIVMKIKSNHQDSIGWDCQFSAEGTTSEEDFCMATDINNQINCKKKLNVKKNQSRKNQR